VAFQAVIPSDPEKEYPAFSHLYFRSSTGNTFRRACAIPENVDKTMEGVILAASVYSSRQT
jgi:hypothetical protein